MAIRGQWPIFSYGRLLSSDPKIFFLTVLSLFVCLSLLSSGAPLAAESRQTEPLSFLSAYEELPWERTEEDIAFLPNDKLKELLSHYRFLLKSETNLGRRQLLRMAIAYGELARKNPADALKTLNETSSAESSFSDIYLYLFAESESMLAKMEIEKGHLNRGVSLLKGAIEKYKAVTRHAPESPLNAMAHSKIFSCSQLQARSLMKLKRYDMAIKAFEKAATFAGSRDEKNGILLSKAEACICAGRLDEAMKIYAGLLKDGFKKRIICSKIRSIARRKEKKDVSKNIRTCLDICQKSLSSPQEILESLLSSRNIASWLKRLHQAMINSDCDAMADLIDDIEATLKLPAKAQKKLDSLDSLLMRQCGQAGFDMVLVNTIAGLTNMLPAEDRLKISTKISTLSYTDLTGKILKAIYDTEIDQPTKSQLAFSLARLNETARRYGEAIRYYDICTRTALSETDRKRALYKKAWVSYLTGNHEESYKLFWELIINQCPTDLLPSAFFWLGTTCRLMGRNDEATIVFSVLENGFPLTFYGSLARIQTGEKLDKFLMERRSAADLRLPDAEMGMEDKYRILRAKALASVRLSAWAVKELSMLDLSEKDRKIKGWLARTFYKIRDYRRAIITAYSSFIDGGTADYPIPKELIYIIFPVPENLKEFVWKEAEKNNVDPYWLLAIMKQESAFDPRAVSSANAIGLMQFILPTAVIVSGDRGLTIDDLKRPSFNIKLGAYYFASLLKKYGGNVVYALGAYNAGEDRMDLWIEQRGDLDTLEFIESIPFTETKKYIQYIVRNYIFYNALYENRYFTSISEVLQHTK